MLTTKYFVTLFIFLTSLVQNALGGYTSAACHPMDGQQPGFTAKF